jgi:hypothetical protein
LKKLRKLLSLYQAARRGHCYGSSHRPWKRQKRSGASATATAATATRLLYGPDHGPYGHARPRGLKGVVIDAIVRELLKHR